MLCPSCVFLKKRPEVESDNVISNGIGRLSVIERNQAQGARANMRGRESSGVYLQGALKQRGFKKAGARQGVCVF